MVIYKNNKKDRERKIERPKKERDRGKKLRERVCKRERMQERERGREREKECEGEKIEMREGKKGKRD